uniref:Regulatory protein n=1 Tax=Siphoviridae sp. ctGkF2 TaxID=2827823 RepID=A0A8S5TLE8_9CAUD|nr:MAG TPA: regulatory protein [Siphoviridae sp. ctGkF2]
MTVNSKLLDRVPDLASEHPETMVQQSETGELTTTSLVIAEGTEIQHKNVLGLVRKNATDFEEFGLLAFQTRARLEGSHGGGDTEYAVLNRDQALLLITYMRNNARVRALKKALVKAFSEMERRLQRYEPELTAEQLMAKALLQAEQTMLEQTQAIEALNTRVEDMEPSYNLGEALLSTEDNIYVGDMAKMLKSRGLFYGGRTKLFAWLKDNDYIMKTGSSGYAALQRWLDRGILDVEEHVYEPFFGEPKLRYTIKVTPKGQEHFINKFKKELALS